MSGPEDWEYLRRDVDDDDFDEAVEELDHDRKRTHWDRQYEHDEYYKAQKRAADANDAYDEELDEDDLDGLHEHVDRQEAAARAAAEYVERNQDIRQTKSEHLG